MITTVITMTALTHPLHMLLIGAILFHGARTVISAAAEAARRAGSGTAPPADFEGERLGLLGQR